MKSKSLNDSISFKISKSWNTKQVSEQYSEIKNKEKNNFEISEINITYEKNIGVYEGHFSDKDYDLNINEIEDIYLSSDNRDTGL